jgi:hypothetical protein
MAVYTYSTKSVKHPEDDEAIEAVKVYCERNKLNLSAIIVAYLKQYKKDHVE